VGRVGTLVSFLILGGMVSVSKIFFKNVFGEGESGGAHL
jgi:O-antigen/teichoic acid export membrane protein